MVGVRTFWMAVYAGPLYDCSWIQNDFRRFKVLILLMASSTSVLNLVGLVFSKLYTKAAKLIREKHTYSVTNKKN